MTDAIVVGNSSCFASRWDKFCGAIHILCRVRLRLRCHLASYPSLAASLSCLCHYLIGLPLHMDSYLRVYFRGTQPRPQSLFPCIDSYQLKANFPLTLNGTFKWMNGMVTRQVGNSASSVAGVYWECRLCDSDEGLWSHVALNLDECWLCKSGIFLISSKCKFTHLWITDSVGPTSVHWLLGRWNELMHIKHWAQGLVHWKLIHSFIHLFIQIPERVPGTALELRIQK